MLDQIIEAGLANDKEKLRALLSTVDINAPVFGKRNNLLLCALIHHMNDRPQKHNWSDHTITTTFTILHEMGVKPDLVHNEVTPLLEALQEGMHHVAKELVAIMGADPNMPVTRDLCIEYDMAGHGEDIFQELIHLGCEPPRDGRYTELMFFSGGQKSDHFFIEKLTWLLDMGLINIEERDPEHLDTPLHCAMMRLDLLDLSTVVRRTQKESDEEEIDLANKLATILLARGADPLLKNRNGQTPLDIWDHHRRKLDTADGRGDTDAVKELLMGAMADRLDQIDEQKFNAFAASPAGVLLGDHICTMLIRPLAVIAHPRGLMAQRREQLAEILGAEGIPAIGCYYADCVNGIQVINIREFRLRHHIATTGAPEYRRIVQRLRWSKGDGMYYQGIHTEARAEFKARLERRGVHFDVPGVIPATTGPEDDGEEILSPTSSAYDSEEPEPSPSDEESEDNMW